MTAEAPSNVSRPHALAPLGFLLVSVVCQTIALAAAAALRVNLESVLAALPPAAAASGLIIVQAAIAWCIAGWAKLPGVWRWFNLLVVPAAASIAAFPVPGELFTGIVIAVVLLYLPTFWTRVPYYPTSPETYERIDEFLPKTGSFRLIDLGCGFAPLLRFLARRHPEAHFEGVEISPLAFIGARIRCLPFRNISIRCASIWKVDLSAYDVVYAFLAPGPMPELWAKVSREMRPGSVFISNTFEAPVKADETAPINDRRRATLFIYRPAGAKRP